MEVHHHTQSNPSTSSGHRDRKKWTHYFWEFLMLFLAVFCGFLAEYMLEHTIEHQREKQYMNSMLEDLKSDTIMFADNIKSRQLRISMMDSLVILLSSPSSLIENGSDVYFFARSISPPTNIFPNDRTIQQLKSSGSLRLIRNGNISNSIMAYDQKMRSALFEMGDEFEIRSEYRQTAKKVFDAKVFYDISAGESITRPESNPALHRSDAETINELIGVIQYLRRVQLAQMIRSKELSVQAKQLLEQIKEEYYLQ